MTDLVLFVSATCGASLCSKLKPNEKSIKMVFPKNIFWLVHYDFFSSYDNGLVSL